MGNKDNISIVVASDNHFAILLGALIKSIEVNHKTAEKIDVYVLDDGISPKNKGRLNSMVDHQMITLYWIDKNKIVPESVALPIDNSIFPFTAYYRLFAPQIIPEVIEKLIYIDVDMIVLEDISRLWHTDINNALFAAVQDRSKVVSCDWAGIKNYKELGIPADTKYLNSGLLVIDTRKWRNENAASKVLEVINRNFEFINFPDQYGLNVAFYDQWHQLDDNWNWPSILENKNPYIIHFTGTKPIFKSYNFIPEFQKIFYDYLKLTPWKDHQPVSHFKLLYKKLRIKIKKKIIGIIN